MKKKIAILGSTGTLGVHALHIIENNPDRFEAAALTANKNAELLIAQAQKYRPKLVCLTGMEYDRGITERLPKGHAGAFRKR